VGAWVEIFHPRKNKGKIRGLGFDDSNPNIKMSIWTPGRIPNVGTRFAMGVWLNYRKLASGVQLASQKDRRQFMGKVANWYPIYTNAALAGQASDRGSFVAKGNMKIAALLGSFIDSGEESPSPNGFAVQFFDAGSQQLWSAQPLVWNQTLGNAQHPFWLRTPYALDPDSPLTVTVQNLSPNAADIQVCLFGYQD